MRDCERFLLMNLIRFRAFACKLFFRSRGNCSAIALPQWARSENLTTQYFPFVLGMLKLREILWKPSGCGRSPSTSVNWKRLKSRDWSSESHEIFYSTIKIFMSIFWPLKSLPTRNSIRPVDPNAKRGQQAICIYFCVFIPPESSRRRQQRGKLNINFIISCFTMKIYRLWVCGASP